MRILLVEPSTVTEQGLYKESIRPIRNLALALPYVAAITPAEIEVDLAYDVCEDLESDYDFASYDLIGITSQTIHLKRALELARKATQKGRPVVIGGPVTQEADEQLIRVLTRFCTSVIVGEAEESWQEFLNDLKCRSPKKVYRNCKPVSLVGLPVPRFDLVNLDQFLKPHVLPCMTSRGCPRGCSFCSYALRSSWRLRPVDEVIFELSSYKTRFGISRVMFRDDDLLVHKERSRDLINKMIPLGLEWGCQTDLSLARHADILNLAIESGMHSISLGLESIVDANRRAVHKNFFSMAEVENMLKMLYEHGIEVQVNIIFGFDYDTPDIFDETVDFLVRNQVSTCLFSILVPIPGTPLYNQLLNENRLMDVRPPGNDNPLYVGFKPKQMTIEQLVAGYSRAKERFRRERRNPIYWLGSGNHTWTEA